jgi:hypothetical protein
VSVLQIVMTAAIGAVLVSDAVLETHEAERKGVPGVHRLHLLGWA